MTALGAEYRDAIAAAAAAHTSSLRNAPQYYNPSATSSRSPARIDRRAHNKDMLTRLLRRPLGLWRAQASLSLLDAFAPRPVLAGAGVPCDVYDDAGADDHLWFAVPKSRISKSKKRTKAHGRLQNLKFKPRSDWRVDENTGRPVLRHRLLDSDLDATVERVREAKKRTEEEVTKEDN